MYRQSFIPKNDFVKQSTIVTIRPTSTVSEIADLACWTKIAQFLADRTNGRAIGTVFRLSVCRLSSVCNVMYCG